MHVRQRAVQLAFPQFHACNYSDYDTWVWLRSFYAGCADVVLELCI